MLLFLSRTLWVFPLALCLLLFTSSDAYAQKSNFPEFSLSDNPEENIIKQTSEEKASITIKRPLTRDILLLHEQINLLEALVKRQSEISKIANSYERVGLPFTQPKPELSICEKLPENVLCLYSYPNLERHKVFFDDARTRFEISQNEAIEAALAEITEQMQAQNALNNSIIDNSSSDDFSNDIDEIAENIESQQVIQKVERDEFIWSDIQCLQTKCSALIISTSDSTNRFRVSSGQHLNEHTIVQSITPMGVTAKIKGKVKEIKPLALEGNTQAVNEPTTVQEMSIPTSGETVEMPINDILQANEITAGTQTTTQENQAPAPLLGPTGLF